MVRPQVHDGHEVRHLLQVGLPLRLTGDTSWRRRSSRARAKWLLDGGYGEVEYWLQMWISLETPGVYTVGLRLDDDQLNIRVDVRQDHRPLDGLDVLGSHLHDIRHGAVVAPSVPPFPSAIFMPEVSPGEYFETVRAFCTHLGIRMESFRWVQPDLEALATEGGE